MSQDADAIPDLVVVVRRDGSLLWHAGGRALPELGRVDGATFVPRWSASTQSLLQRLARKSIAERRPAESQFSEYGSVYEIRANAQGPDRAACVIRRKLVAPDGSADTLVQTSFARLDRRGFLRRFKESIAEARLREHPLALAVVLLDEIGEITQAFATQISEQILATALARLPMAGRADTVWYVGQLGENALGVVIESTDRDTIEACVRPICANLRQPIAVGDAHFHLTPFAGAALLDDGTNTVNAMLDHARACASEARRTSSTEIVFYSDTVQIKSLARLDFARELREGLEGGQIGLRYARRHDLATGELLAWVGYLRWRHPLRGEIRPAQFLPAAQTIGLSTELSRAILNCLRADFAQLAASGGSETRISLGALRNHLLHPGFTAEVDALLDTGDVPAERLELRISERVFAARAALELTKLGRRGVHLVVDEVGRGALALPQLATAGLHGLQLDREWVRALLTEPLARSICRAGILLAGAFGLHAIASGVDDVPTRDALRELGCASGTGDLFGEASAAPATPRRR